MESALVPIRGGWRRLRHSASFVSLSSLSKAGRASTGEVTPLDWWAVLGIQSLSMISILSSTMVFSTAVFMVREWGAVDEAKAAAHAGLMIAAKPGFSALSSYAWGRRGDTTEPEPPWPGRWSPPATAAGRRVSFHWRPRSARSRASRRGHDADQERHGAHLGQDEQRQGVLDAMTYGLGSSVGPTVAALLAYPCGGDPNVSSSNTRACPARVLRAYPFLLSTAWVGALGLALWTFAFLCMKIPEEDDENHKKQNASGDGGRRTPGGRDADVEMASVAEIHGFETQGAAKGTRLSSEDEERGDGMAAVALAVAESDESDGEGEDAALLSPSRRKSRGWTTLPGASRRGTLLKAQTPKTQTLKRAPRGTRTAPCGSRRTRRCGARSS